MPIIIDGYNLLNHCGFVGSRIGPGTLERARGLFLGFLVQALPAEQVNQTRVVFDSAMRLPELPDYWEQDGLQIHFASGHQDADEMIIEMLQKDSAPRQLLIVSSDHQIQQAARRRKAAFVDSDRWFEELIASANQKPEAQATAHQLKTQLTLEKKSGEQALNQEETQRWLEQFLPQSPNASSVASTDSGPDQAADEDFVSRSGSPGQSNEPRRDSSAANQSSPTPKRTKREKFSQTSWQELAGDARRHRSEQPDPGTSSPTSENLPDDSSPNAASAGDRTVDQDPRSLGEFEQLDLGGTMDRAQLKHDLMVPEDEEQWLQDFDRQFGNADLGAGASDRVLRKKKNVPHHDRPGRNRPKDPQSGPPSNSSPELPVSDESGQEAAGQETLPDGLPASEQDTRSAASTPRPGSKPSDQNIDVDSRQLDRWNRQLKETDDQIFPPGYAEDILFAETFETDERLRRKRRRQ